MSFPRIFSAFFTPPLYVFSCIVFPSQLKTPSSFVPFLHSSHMNLAIPLSRAPSSLCSLFIALMSTVTLCCVLTGED